MTDVRLTATNPEDSSVVPVACNEKGELILEEPGEGPPGEKGDKGDKGDPGDPFTGNFEGDVSFTGGSVGIGTTNPVKTLHVNGDVIVKSASAYLANCYYSNNQWNYLDASKPSGYLNLASGTNRLSLSYADAGDTPLERLVMDGDGNVGIGTTDPKGALHVYDANNTYCYFQTNTADELPNDTIQGLAIGWNRVVGSRHVNFICNSIQKGLNDAGGFQFSTQSNDGDFQNHVLINGIGNVGIGTESPSSPLDVGGKCGFLDDGGIWMTDKRGNTYRTDFVSNGMMYWIEYDPPERRDQLEALGDRIKDLGQSTQDGTTTDIDDPRLK